MKIPMNAFSDVIEMLLRTESKKATKYLSPDAVVKATRPHKPSIRSRSTTLVVTFGKPNYAEREFIKSCRKAGEPFPVRKVQLKHFSEKRA